MKGFYGPAASLDLLVASSSDDGPLAEALEVAFVPGPEDAVVVDWTDAGAAARDKAHDKAATLPKAVAAEAPGDEAATEPEPEMVGGPDAAVEAEAEAAAEEPEAMIIPEGEGVVKVIVVIIIIIIIIIIIAVNACVHHRCPCLC